LRDLFYDFNTDSYRSPELSILSRHMSKTGVVELEWSQEPDGTAWMVRSDGLLIGCTFEKDQEVSAWHRHVFGGNGVVESIAVIPDPTITYDEVWLIVRRTINGQTKRYVEYIDKEWTADLGIEAAFYVDCGVKYDGTKAVSLTIDNPAIGTSRTFTAGSATFASGDVGKEIWELQVTTAADGRLKDIPVTRIIGRATITGFTSSTVVTATIYRTFSSTTIVASSWAVAVNGLSGLSHLEGATVQVLTDGSTHPNKVVSSGTISLDRFTSRACAGLGYQSKGRTMPVEPKGVQVTIQGRTKRIVNSVIKFFETVGCKYGNAESNLEPLQFRLTSDELGVPTQPFTGDKEVDYRGGFELAGQVVFIQDQPLPFKVLSILHDTDVKS
jgi:hypothetical protein